MTAPQATTFLESVHATETDVDAARTALAMAIKARDAAREGNGMVAREIRDAVGLQFSQSLVDLDALAIAPPKARRPLSGEAKVVFAEKLRATRKARGTTSKQQKAATIFVEQLFELRAVA